MKVKYVPVRTKDEWKKAWKDFEEYTPTLLIFPLFVLSLVVALIRLPLILLTLMGRHFFILYLYVRFSWFRQQIYMLLHTILHRQNLLKTGKEKKEKQ